MAAAAAQGDGGQDPICAKMRTASKKIHKLSDAILQARLIVLFTDRSIYGSALGCFYPVFQALEEALTATSSTNPDVKKVWPQLSNGLFRAPGFKLDLEYYLGPNWESKIPRGKAMAAYVAHIKHLASTNPTLLLAHAYTQHNALASGGQIIKRMAQRQMELPDDRGGDAFTFKEPGAPVIKAAFISALDKLGESMSPEVKEQMVQEHIAAFKFNNAIIQEFRLGWWSFFKGLVLLLPVLTRVSILMMLVALTAAWYWKPSASPTA